jgi:hypothetical protein
MAARDLRVLHFTETGCKVDRAAHLRAAANRLIKSIKTRDLVQLGDLHATPRPVDHDDQASDYPSSTTKRNT